MVVPSGDPGSASGSTASASADLGKGSQSVEPPGEPRVADAAAAKVQPLVQKLVVPSAQSAVHPARACIEDGNASRLLAWLQEHMRTKKAKFMRVSDMLESFPLSAALGAGTLGEVRMCFREGLLKLEKSKDIFLNKPSARDFETWVVDFVGGEIPIAAACGGKLVKRS